MFILNNISRNPRLRFASILFIRVVDDRDLKLIIRRLCQGRIIQSDAADWRTNIMQRREDDGNNPQWFVNILDSEYDGIWDPEIDGKICS